MSDRIEPPKFPLPVTINGRRYLWRSHLEHHKEQLASYARGLAPQPLPTTRPQGDSLVPVNVSARELGVCRRTIGRRIAEAAAVGAE